jgi:RNA-binding protein YhbY
MKIKLTPKEAQTLQNIASSIDEEVVEEITEVMKDNKLIKIEVLPTGVTIKIDSDYTEEFLSVYGKFIKLIVPQIKTMYETVILFQEEAEKVIEKYTEEETEESEGEDNG